MSRRNEETGTQENHDNRALLKLVYRSSKKAREEQAGRPGGPGEEGARSAPFGPIAGEVRGAEPPTGS